MIALDHLLCSEGDIQCRLEAIPVLEEANEGDGLSKYTLGTPQLKEQDSAQDLLHFRKDLKCLIRVLRR